MKFLRAAFIIAILSIPTLSYAQIGPISSTPVSFYVSPTYTNATTTFSSVTGLAFAVNPNGVYHVTCHITWQANVALTASPKYQWTGPNASTLTMLSNLTSSIGLTTFATSTITTYSTLLAQTASAGLLGTNFIDVIEFALINGANVGTVQLQAAANGVGTLSILAGSNCIVQ